MAFFFHLNLNKIFLEENSTTCVKPVQPKKHNRDFYDLRVFIKQSSY